MADESNWQNHVDSKQRGSVTSNVNARRHGEEEVPKPNKYPREGSIEDSEGADDSGNSDEEPDWSDPDFEKHFPNYT